MGANQIDHTATRTSRRSARCNTPPGQMFGVRGAPGNTINHATSYWVGNHTSQVFCDAVDVVSGIGWDKVDSDNPAYRFVNVYRVVSNLGVFDFGGPGRTMRAVSLHQGWTQTTSGPTPPSMYTASMKPRAPGCPPARSSTLIRTIDPKGLRDKEVKL